MAWNEPFGALLRRVGLYSGQAQVLVGVNSQSPLPFYELGTSVRSNTF